MLEILQKLPHLCPNFSRSVYCCATFNFGPATCTFKHRDSLNAPWGMCAITADGSYNPKTGGHIILWELGLVIEFPPVSTILIPSATITHSNIAVSEGETRVSFTQYTAGGIFRWLDNGGRTEKLLEIKDPVEFVKICKLKTGRWEEGLARFTKLSDLQ